MALSPDAQRIREALVQVARRQSVMSYTDAGRLCQPPLDMHNDADQRQLSLLLGEISDEEARHHRPLLSALVIHKDGSSPGAGFYEAAARARVFTGGTDPVARLTFFVQELQRVHDAHWG